METNKLVGLILLASLLLVGCGKVEDAAKLKVENERLAAEIVTLRSEVEKQAGQRSAEILEATRQATVSEGCTWLFPVCSSEVVEHGKEAIKRGYSPSGLITLFVIGKMASIAVFLGILGGILWVFYQRKVRPDATKAAVAASQIKTLDEETARIQQKHSEIERELAQLEQKKVDFLAELKDLHEKVTTGQKQVDTLGTKSAELQEAIKIANLIN